MSDLTRYRPCVMTDLPPEQRAGVILSGDMALVRDDSLQQIADAWDGSWQKEIRELSWELAGLLDGLVNDE